MTLIVTSSTNYDERFGVFGYQAKMFFWPVTMQGHIWQGKWPTYYGLSIGQSSINRPHTPTLPLATSISFPISKNIYEARNSIQMMKFKPKYKFFSSQDPQFYATGIEKLVIRYYKCLHNLGDYVEK